MRSAATAPNRPVFDVTGTTWTSRRPTGPGATKSAEGPAIRSSGMSEARPVHARIDPRES